MDQPGLGGGTLKDAELQFTLSVAEAECTLSVEVGTFHSSLFSSPSCVSSVSQELCQARGKAMMNKTVLVPLGAHERVGL